MDQLRRQYLPLVAVLLLPLSVVAQETEINENIPPSLQAVALPLLYDSDQGRHFHRTPQTGLRALSVRKDANASARLPPPGQYIRNMSEDWGLLA